MKKHKIAFDTTLMRPGCVLIQAALGADYRSYPFHRLFDARVWITHLSDNMRVFEISDEQLEKLSAMVQRHHPEQTGT